jgi:hypothetical protein
MLLLHESLHWIQISASNSKASTASNSKAKLCQVMRGVKETSSQLS